MRHHIRGILVPAFVRHIKGVLLSFAALPIQLHTVELISRVRWVVDCNRTVAIEQIAVEEGECQLD